MRNDVATQIERFNAGRDPERLGAAWDEALASDVPTLLEVKTDPEVPPLPPH